MLVFVVYNWKQINIYNTRHIKRLMENFQDTIHIYYLFQNVHIKPSMYTVVGADFALLFLSFKPIYPAAYKKVYYYCVVHLVN